MLNKAMETLNTWQPNQQEEIELELNAELWCRLGRLAININTNAAIKIGLFCAESCFNNACTNFKGKKFNSIPTTRLRWYAVAESLYGEALYKLLDTQKQEKDSQDKLLHMAVSHFVESCALGAKSQISFLVLESAKLMWNALILLLDQPHNRKLLIKPLASVHTNLKSVHESSDPDFLVLLYSALFACIQE
jgi:translation elongation factor EF-1alpha